MGLAAQARLRGRFGAMETEPEPIVVKLDSPTAIAEAMPTFVGFHPRESLVVMCLRGPRKRNGLTMRIDLPDARHDRALAADLSRRAAIDKADAAIVVCYTSAPDTGGLLPRTTLVDEQIEQLRRRGIGLAEALLVRAGRWFSYTCAQDCCPREGTPIPDEPSGPMARLAAERALTGRAVLPDRGALVASVAGPVALRLVALRQTYDRVDASVAGEIADEGLDPVCERTIALARRAFGRYVEGRRQLDDADAARIVLGLHDKHARDELTTWAIDGHADELIAFLTDLAQRTPDRDAAPICTVLASAAYQHSDGALAAVALERALRSDPSYRMAWLLFAMLDRQVDPDEVQALSRDVRRDLRRRAG